MQQLVGVRCFEVDFRQKYVIVRSVFFVNGGVKEVDVFFDQLNVMVMPGMMPLRNA